MVDEFPYGLEDNEDYQEWTELLAENAIRSARGQAADAEYTGDLASTPEGRIKTEVELEIDDKIDVLAEARSPFDVLRFTDSSPTKQILDTLTPDRTTREAALQLAHDALVQDVRRLARKGIGPK